jgi:hypothetical protein
VQRKNWAPRVRVNSVNSRFRSATGDIRFLIDPVNCPELAIDFDEVQTVKGGSGEIDKSDGERTHHSDGAGYYITRRFPMGGGYKVENKQI